MKKHHLLLITIVAAGAALVFFLVHGKESGAGASERNKKTMPVPTTSVTSAQAKSQLAKLAASPVATMTTSLGTITMRFYTTDAPELTKNFLELAKAGYYNNLTFQRIVQGFVIQGGDPKGDGTGGHSYKGEGVGLADEPGALALKHFRGAVAWAKSSLPNSIGSQFYIAVDDLQQLDGNYSVFGQVVGGMDVVDRIAAVRTDTASKPLQPVTIHSITIAE